MTKYKILFVDHTPFIGGAQLALVRHLKCLSRHVFTPLVVCSASNAPLLNLLKERKVEAVTIPFARFKVFSPLVFWRFFRTFFSLLLIAKRERPDLIVSNTERAVYPAFLVAKILHLPLIFWVRDFEYPRLLIKALSLWVGRLVFVSRVVRDYYGFTSSPKARVVYVGTDLSYCRPEGSTTDPSGLRTKWGLVANDIAIGFAGRLVAWKGVMTLLVATALLKKAWPSEGQALKVIIAGEGRGQEGENVDELKAYVRQHDLEGVVSFVGFLQNMALFYKSLDIFVHPSLKPEPFATVVVEAMAAGLPVAASQVGGTPEIIREGENGLLFPPGNTPALAGCLRKLLADANLRQRLGRAAYQTVAKDFTEEKVTRELEAVYREVV